jgi:CRISPR-associated exonuclease Cas4
MYDEDDLLPISGLQHLLFCKRRAALVHTEGLWGDNRFTVVGRIVHERVHSVETESRKDVRIARGLWIRSLRLGLTGKTDVVEFRRMPDDGNFEAVSTNRTRGVSLDGLKGMWGPFPIEYKSGYLRHEEGYEIQLCAQAICLEEMLGAFVPEGAIFYSRTGRRLDISFDEGLRARTEQAAAMLRDVVQSGITPTAVYEPKCEKCSLLEICLPKTTGSSRSVTGFLKKFSDSIQAELP